MPSRLGLLDPLREIGKIFEAARIASGEKQEAFAKELGVTQPHLSRIEKGAKPPGPQLIRKLADKYGADQNRLFRLLQEVKGIAAEDPAIAPEKGPLEKTIAEGFAPVVGRAACGKWIEAIAEDRTPSGEKRMEEIPKWHKVKDKRAFFVEAAGDSMIGTGIDEGALLLVEPKVPLQTGNHALVFWRDKVTVKIWRESGESWLLMPTNPKYDPIVVSKKEFEEGGGRAFRITMIKTARSV